VPTPDRLAANRRTSHRRPAFIAAFVVLGAVFALRGCLLDADSGVASLADQLAQQMPEARVLVGADGVLRVIHPDGLVQTLDLDPLQRTCASQPGTCEVEIRRLLAVFAASRAAGFARDSADGARLRPFVVPGADAEPLAATVPLADMDAPASAAPTAPQSPSTPPAASTGMAPAPALRVGFGLWTGEVMALVTPAVLANYGVDLPRLRAEAVAALDADPAPVRLDPVVMTKGVSQLHAPGDPAAQLLSRARMSVLLGVIQDRRVAFALPRRGRLLLARDREPDRSALAAAAPAANPPPGNSAAPALSIHTYELGAPGEPDRIDR